MSTPLLQTRKDTGVGDGVRQLVEGAYLLPSQWQPVHDGIFATPAGHLFAAVLESAVHEFELYRYAKSPHAARYATKARAWFDGDPRPCLRAAGDVDCRCDTCWPLSFVNCCAALAIDADKLRSKVLDGQPVFAGRRYRVSIVRGLGQARIYPRR